MKNSIWLAVSGSVAAIVAGAVLMAGVASAQGMPQDGQGGFMAGNHMPGVFGTVSVVNGTTLTVTSRAFNGFHPGMNATTSAAITYTVDASNATVMKNGTSSSVSSVDVGDMIFVQGTVNGTNVTATTIRDGVPVPGSQMGSGGMRGHFGGAAGGFGNATGTHGPWNASGTWNGSSTMPRRGVPQNLIQGNGQPVVGGSVTAVSGSTLTVTTAQNDVVYTIDASNATVEKGGATSTIANIAVGDDVLVQGSVSGTAVTAFSVIDQGAPRTATSTSGTGGSSNGGGKGFGGFMSAIGGMFHRIFGFF